MMREKSDRERQEETETGRTRQKEAGRGTKM